MIIEGFGLPQQYNLDIEELNNSNDSRMTRYLLPEQNKDLEIALVPHTDKGTLSIICHNEVQERLAFILFTVPKEYMTIKVPSELVDEENHPLRYRPFKYEDFINFHYSTRTEKGVLEEFAGL
ncbi:uncharacterized protein [Cicer arietinum]|uniref:Uncharacterized protein LOC101491239 n=1 Tax=Cicer arietinum TaxID=3827 RepID=A0A1S2Z911_CICAR|nr:uncharacterized protein LOC101491239 [Cicer arietinum]